MRKRKRKRRKEERTLERNREGEPWKHMENQGSYSGSANPNIPGCMGTNAPKKVQQNLERNREGELDREGEGA
jgi:hypothetical protein